MSTKPKVSIGVPVYNGENYLAETLDSLLQQSYTDFEIIISDNASTDSTQAICKKYEAVDNRIKYFRYDVNKGAAWNFNNTFHLAKGEYFKWAAHDDPHMPDFLNRCVQILDEKPEVVLCFTGALFIDENGRKLKEHTYPLDLLHLSLRDRFRHFVMSSHIVYEIFGLIRARALQNTPLIAGYLGSDRVLLGMLALKGPFFEVNEILFQHREHDKRSMINPQGAENMTQWFASSKKGKYVFPFLRHTFENTKNILFAANLSFKQKITSLYDILRVINWNKRKLMKEISKNIELLISRK